MYNSLLDIAIASVYHGIKHRARLPVNPDDYPLELHTKGVLFASITNGTKQLGCIGNTKEVPLYLAASINGYRAAFEDLRYPTPTPKTLNQCSMQLYHICLPKRYRQVTERYLDDIIRPNNSILVSYMDKSAYLLNTVQNTQRGVSEFVSTAATKAGIPKTVPYSDLTITVFDTILSDKKQITEPTLD